MLLTPLTVIFMWRNPVWTKMCFFGLLICFHAFRQKVSIWSQQKVLWILKACPTNNDERKQLSRIFLLLHYLFPLIYQEKGKTKMCCPHCLQSPSNRAAPHLCLSWIFCRTKSRTHLSLPDCPTVRGWQWPNLVQVTPDLVQQPQCTPLWSWVQKYII